VRKALNLLIAWFPTILTAQTAKPSAKISFESLFPSVVTLITFSSDGEEIAQGSGFILKDKRIATNRHVLEGAKIVEVKNSKGELLASFAHAEAISMTADVAILPAIEKAKTGLSLSAQAPKIGDKIFAIGSPLGLPNTLSDGIVSAMRTDMGTPMIQITAPISPGSSGGPVLSEKGEVLGITTATIRAGQNLNFAVPTSVVQALMLSPSAKIDFPSAKNTKQTMTPEPTEIKRAKERPALEELIPKAPIGYIDEKQFMVYQMGCFAEEGTEKTICLVDLEVKNPRNVKYTLGISPPPVLTSPQGGQVSATGVWLGDRNFFAFGPGVEFYQYSGRERVYIIFDSTWREGAGYQLVLSIYGGESELRKFWLGGKQRGYTFNPQTIQFIDGKKSALTRKLLGIE